MTEHELPVNDENENPEETTAEVDYEDMNTVEQFFFHQRRAIEETRKAIETLLPPGFKDHSTEASREFAKGFRVLVDAAIDELKKVSEPEEGEAGEDEDKPSTTGSTKVKVQVD